VSNPTLIRSEGANAALDGKQYADNPYLPDSQEYGWWAEGMTTQLYAQ
jgi:hypothetical protein